MTEEKSAGTSEAPPEVEGKNPASISVEVAPEITLEDIDNILSEEDPEFTASLKNISQDKNLSIADIEMEAQAEALAEEVKKWEASGKFGQMIYRIFPKIPMVTYRWSLVKFYVFSKLVRLRIHLKNFFLFIVKSAIKSALVRTKKGLVDFSAYTSKLLRTFKFLPIQKKLLFGGLVLLVVFTGAFIYRSMTQGVLPKDKILFLPSLEVVADEVHAYDAKDVEPFYDNLRTSSSLLLINKMVVNIRKSQSSGNNPMAAFEFMVEGVAPEVIIEIKDRETEMRDLMQRTLEEMTFDIVSSPEGKEYMCNELKKEINRRLTTGKVKRVYIKTAIVKP